MSQIEINEGKIFAVAMLSAIDGMPKAFFEKDGVTTVLENLRIAAKDRPADYATGILQVVKQVEGAL